MDRMGRCSKRACARDTASQDVRSWISYVAGSMIFADPPATSPMASRAVVVRSGTQRLFKTSVGRSSVISDMGLQSKSKIGGRGRIRTGMAPGATSHHRRGSSAQRDDPSASGEQFQGMDLEEKRKQEMVEAPGIAPEPVGLQPTVQTDYTRPPHSSSPGGLSGCGRNEKTPRPWGRGVHSLNRGRPALVSFRRPRVFRDRIRASRSAVRHTSQRL